MKKTVSRIIISHVIGFIIFLILLAIANMLLPKINILLYSEMINFFNSSILFLLFLMLLGMINEIFWGFYFPFNVLAPVSAAILSKFVIDFIQMIWNLIQNYTVIKINIPFEILGPGVFFIVIITGYILLIARHGKPKEECKKVIVKEKKSIKPKIINRIVRKKKIKKKR